MWRTWISLKSKGHKVSPDVVQHKLYVNILMSTQINEVRGLLGDLPMEMPKFLSDATIRRFLQARNWSTVHAAKSLKEAASWRRQYKPEKICWVNNFSELICKIIYFVTAKKTRIKHFILYWMTEASVLNQFITIGKHRG